MRGWWGVCVCVCKCVPGRWICLCLLLWSFVYACTLAKPNNHEPSTINHKRYHADNEAADLKDFKRALKILARVIAKMEQIA